VKILRNASNWQKSRTICEAVFYMLYIRFTDNWEEPVPAQTFRLPRSRRLMLTGFGLWQPGFMTWSATVVRRLSFKLQQLKTCIYVCIYISHVHYTFKLINWSVCLQRSWIRMLAVGLHHVLMVWHPLRINVAHSNSHQYALHNQFASYLSGSFSYSFNRNYNVCNCYIFILWSLVS